MKATTGAIFTQRARAKLLSLCAGLATCFASVAFAQTDDPGLQPAIPRATKPAPLPPLKPSLKPWLTRLESLSPSDPEAYLLLGEEVLDRAADEDERRLAMELLTLAFDLARAHDAGSPVATSACLALADASSVRSDRRRLRSLAGSLAPRRADTPRTATLNVESPEYLTSTALTLTRTGMGFHAKSVLRKPEVLQQLESMDGLLERFGVPGGADGVIREVRRWPCPECGNQRITRKREGQPRLCPNCNGEPGPKITRTDLLAYLRAEFWLVRDSRQPWSLQVLLDDGQPAQLADPTLVARLFRVDTTKPYFRRNAWRTNADGTDTAPTTQSQQLAPLPTTTSDTPQPQSDPNAAPAQPATQPTAPTQQPATQPTIPVPTIPIPQQPKPGPGEEPLPGEIPYPLGPK